MSTGPFDLGGIVNWGTAQFNGGGNGPFNIAHNMTPQPDYATVNAGSLDTVYDSVTPAVLTFYWTIDSTNIVVNFNLNTPSGTNNVILHWTAGRRYSVRDQIHSVTQDTEEY